MKYVPKGYYIDTGYTEQLEAAFLQKTMTDLSKSMQKEFIESVLTKTRKACSTEMSREDITEILYKNCDEIIDALTQKIPDELRSDRVFIYRINNDVIFSFVIIYTAIHLDQYIDFLYWERGVNE